MHGAGEGVALQGIRSNANCNNNDLGKFVMHTHNGDVVFFVLDKGCLLRRIWSTLFLVLLDQYLEKVRIVC